MNIQLEKSIILIFSSLMMLIYSFPCRGYYKFPNKYPTYVNGKHLAECVIKTNSMPISLDYDKLKYEEIMTHLMGSSRIIIEIPILEKELKNWILAQPENSISPHSIIKKALEFTNGLLLDAFLIIHNELRNNSRYNADYIRYSSNAEKKKTYFNKFIDIRGDLRQRKSIFTKFEGDHDGGWYRFFGMALYHLKTRIDHKRLPNFIENIDLGYSGFISVGSEVYKVILPKFYFADKRKISLNMMGALFSHRLYDFLTSRKLASHEEDCLPSTYILPSTIEWRLIKSLSTKKTNLESFEKCCNKFNGTTLIYRGIRHCRCLFGKEIKLTDEMCIEI